MLRWGVRDFVLAAAVGRVGDLGGDPHHVRFFLRGLSRRSTVPSGRGRYSLERVGGLAQVPGQPGDVNIKAV